MKLIRLATNNNGEFTNSFGNEMILEPYSKMALLNLTFATNIGTFVVIPAGAVIDFKSDTTNILSNQTNIPIPNRSYTVAELDTFYKDVQHALNGAMSSNNSITGATADPYPGVGYNSSIGGAFRIGTTTSGLKTIEFRYAPFINPIQSFDNPLYQNMVWASAKTDITFDGGAGVGERFTIIKKNGGETATTDRSNKILPLNGRRLNDGTSFFMARVRDLTDNGSGGQDNGFGIGLSKTNLGLNFNADADINPTERDFEIRINRAGENYVYIQRSINPDEVDSGWAPTRITGGSVNDHDILFFRVSANVLTMGVVNETNPGGVPQFSIFGSPIPIVAGEELYPYLYLRGAAANCEVDAFNFSVDPWLPSIGGDEDGNNFWELTGKTDSAIFNGYDDIMRTSSLFRFIPQLLPTRFTESKKFNLLLDRSTLRGLGFTQFAAGDGTAGFAFAPISRSANPPFWKIIVAKTLPAGYTSDNFLVESMSIPLDSYDASTNGVADNSGFTYNNGGTTLVNQGRRKNILMTIPENDNTTGLVEFESSTPIFIDIGNASRINTKNLDFRILRKDFTPIVQTDQTAIMTILIDSMDKRNM